MIKLTLVLGLSVLGSVATLLPQSLPVQAVPVSQVVAGVSLQQGLQKLDSQDFRGAIAIFNQLLTKNANQAEIYLYRGFAQQQLGNFSAASTDLKQAMQLNSSYLNPLQTYPRVTSIQAILNPLRVQILTEKINRSPQQIDGYLYRGLAQKSDNPQQAIADFNTALRLQPNFAPAYLYRGTVQFTDEQQLIDFSKAIEVQPNYTEAYLQRGEKYFALGNFSAALKDFNAALKLDSKLIRAYQFRAAIYLRQNQINLALADLDQGIKVAPNQADLYQSRLELYRQQKNYQKAIADVTTLIRLQPENAARNYIERGKLKLQLKDTQGAMADYSQAIRVAPVITTYTDTRFAAHHAYAERAQVRTELKDYRGAISDYTQVLRTAPAGSAFDGAVNSDQIWADVYFKRGELKAKLGDRSGTIQDYQQAIRYYDSRGLTNDSAKVKERLRLYVMGR